MHTTRSPRGARLALAVLATATALAALPATAQDIDKSKDKPAAGFSLQAYGDFLLAHPPERIAAPTLNSIPLAGAGADAGELWERQDGHLSVRNVTQAALYPVLPPPGKANGTAVVIAPGGAFISLAMDTEGLLVARELAARGITCFVLKYRLDASPAGIKDFVPFLVKRLSNAKPRMTRGDLIDTPTALLAQQDGLAAMKHVRSHAADYGIDPKRIGFMGFSAGGMTTMNVASAYDAATRPDFIGVIYGASGERPVPKDAPPAFIALAADDSLLGYASVPIFDAWREAGKSAELHVYARGGHGFGMRKMGGTSDKWLDDFHAWLAAAGFTK